MQLRCSIELSADYIILLYMIFFKIYDKNIIFYLRNKKILLKVGLQYIKIVIISLLYDNLI